MKKKYRSHLDLTSDRNESAVAALRLPLKTDLDLKVADELLGSEEIRVMLVMIHRILSIPVLISFHFEPRVQANYIRALEGINGYNINRWMPLILTHDLARHCSLRGTEKKKSFACLRLFRVIIGECDLRWSIHSP